MEDFKKGDWGLEETPKVIEVFTINTEWCYRQKDILEHPQYLKLAAPFIAAWPVTWLLEWGLAGARLQISP